MSGENVDVIREGWEAWQRGDLPGLFRQFDPDVVWDTSHFHDWPESSYHGIEGVERFLREWLEVWDDLEIEVQAVRDASDERVVSLILQRGTGRSSGLAMEMKMAQVATLRNGKVTRLDNYENHAEALEAAGLSE
ncbi:MAG: nuclear transport factor 2 family protein [Actinomycetota bacterium]|nr:nuclear transport factor 2 family protein [Actinomycetota bacterium]